MTVSPRYDQYKDAWDTNTLVEVNSPSLEMSWSTECCFSNFLQVIFLLL